MDEDDINIAPVPDNVQDREKDGKEAKVYCIYWYIIQVSCDMVSYRNLYILVNRTKNVVD